MKRGLYVLFGAALCFASALCRAAAPTAEELNRVLGTPLFGAEELWKERPAAAVLRLNVNCRAERSGEGRMFAARVARLVFGIQAAEIRIFAVDETIARVDIFLVNKGDSAIGNKRGSDIRKELHRARSDLDKLLRENFGKPRKVFFGEGTLRRQMPAWTAGRYAFVVDYVDGEYLIVRIAPPEKLEDRRRSAETKPEPRESYVSNVSRSENGDVWIANVPMVDQGRKGYCVPATVERLLRYFGVDGVDMHKLAEKYKTGVGGSTRADRMAQGSRKLLADHGLKMRSVGSLTRRTVVKQVDRGIPVVWFHYSTEAFRKRIEYSLNSRRRASPEGWKKILAGQKRIRRRNEDAHVALIIGYNRDTDEFAVSNSWGDRYRIAWVRYADMEQADAKLDLSVVEPRK
ncbi:MAG: C39 family peptidase [Lentisphaeria bacterium]|nr:C39 family peptidase [Lentisphaeria bacterium]